MKVQSDGLFVTQNQTFVWLQSERKMREIQIYLVDLNLALVSILAGLNSGSSLALQPDRLIAP